MQCQVLWLGKSAQWRCLDPVDKQTNIMSSRHELLKWAWLGPFGYASKGSLIEHTYCTNKNKACNREMVSGHIWDDCLFLEEQKCYHNQIFGCLSQHNVWEKNNKKVFKCNAEFTERAFTHHVIVGDSVDDAKVLQVILVRSIVSVPCHHIKWRMVLQGNEKVTLIFGDDLIVGHIPVLVPCHRGQEISGVCKTVCSWGKRGQFTNCLYWKKSTMSNFALFINCIFKWQISN